MILLLLFVRSLCKCPNLLATKKRESPGQLCTVERERLAPFSVCEKAMGYKWGRVDVVSESEMEEMALLAIIITIDRCLYSL